MSDFRSISDTSHHEPRKHTSPVSVRLAALAVVAASTVVACSSPATTAPTSTAPGPAPRTLVSLTLSTRLVGAALVDGPGGPVLVSQESVGIDGSSNATLSGVCGVTAFASEDQRVARRQVFYQQAGEAAASNEVVQYRAGEGRAAFAELTAASRRCPQAYPVGPGSRASHVAVLSAIDSPQTEQVSVQYLMTQPQGPAVWDVAVYQFVGDYLSAVYAFNPDKTSARTTADLLAASVSARLRGL